MTSPGGILPSGDNGTDVTGGYNLFFHFFWTLVSTTRAWSSGGAIQRLFGEYRRRTITGGRSCWRDASQSMDSFDSIFHLVMFYYFEYLLCVVV